MRTALNPTGIARITVQPKSKDEPGLYYIDRGTTRYNGVITGFQEYEHDYQVWGCHKDNYSKEPFDISTDEKVKEFEFMLSNVSQVLAKIPKASSPIIDYYAIPRGFNLEEAMKEATKWAYWFSIDEVVKFSENTPGVTIEFSKKHAGVGLSTKMKEHVSFLSPDLWRDVHFKFPEDDVDIRERMMHLFHRLKDYGISFDSDKDFFEFNWSFKFDRFAENTAPIPSVIFDRVEELKAVIGAD